MVQKMLVTHEYLEAIVLVGVTPDEVVHESKGLLIPGHHTYCLRAPLIHVAYVSEAVDGGLRVGPALPSAPAA